MLMTNKLKQKAVFKFYCQLFLKFNFDSIACFYIDLHYAMNYIFDRCDATHFICSQMMFNAF